EHNPDHRQRQIHPHDLEIWGPAPPGPECAPTPDVRLALRSHGVNHARQMSEQVDPDELDYAQPACADCSCDLMSMPAGFGCVPARIAFAVVVSTPAAGMYCGAVSTDWPFRSFQAVSTAAAPTECPGMRTVNPSSPFRMLARPLQEPP